MGTVKLEICRRLVNDWAELADYFDIPLNDRAKFAKGREPQRVWEWLEARGRLEELPAGLTAIERADLASLLQQSRPSKSPPDAPADRDRTTEPHVFICYAREDWEIASRLYDDLRRAGVNPWIDREDILPGENWKRAIKKAMKESSYILTILSPHSVSKQGYVQKELRDALDLLAHLPPSAIFLLPVRIEECEPEDDQLQEIQWVDLFESYEKGLQRILKVLTRGRRDVEISMEQLVQGRPENVEHAQRSPYDRVEEYDLQATSAPQPAKPAPKTAARPTVSLRSTPKTVSDAESRQEFKRITIEHQYEDQGEVIVDHATGLMWQKSGSDSYLTYSDAQKYVDNLNAQTFAGYGDWRLPTIPELMSLLESEKQSNDLYISPIFDSEQWWCWSVDKRQNKGESSSESAWFVYFDSGYVDWYNLGDRDYVRVVRSRQ